MNSVARYQPLKNSNPPCPDLMTMVGIFIKNTGQDQTQATNENPGISRHHLVVEPAAQFTG